MSTPRSSRLRYAGDFAAFTLVELLAVVAIMLIIASFLVPALAGLFRGKEITRATNDISGIIESMRSEAMAKDTYVWVGFKSTTVNCSGTSGLTATGAQITGTTVHQFQIVGVRSIDGTPSLVVPNTAGTPIVNYKQITSLSSYQNIEMDDLKHVSDVANITAQMGAVPATISYIANTTSANVPVNYGGGSPGSDPFNEGFVIPPKVTATSTDNQFFNIILITPAGEIIAFDSFPRHIFYTLSVVSGKSYAIFDFPLYTEKLFLGLRRTVNGVPFPKDSDAVGILIFGGDGQNRVYREK